MPHEYETIRVVLIDAAKNTIWSDNLKVEVCGHTLRLHLVARKIIHRLGRDRVSELRKVADVGWVIPNAGDEIEWLEELSLEVMTEMWKPVIADPSQLDPNSAE
ncbi:MAG: hypothetical protein JWM11_5915 [Planctomycetaceae bacterium]|nr:hypothetical protein [Planctomycetaceae bacterium]